MVWKKTLIPMLQGAHYEGNYRLKVPEGTQSYERKQGL